jgi:hypothetical protein
MLSFNHLVWPSWQKARDMIIPFHYHSKIRILLDKEVLLLVAMIRQTLYG